MQGTIARVNVERGFGFIACPEDDPRHASHFFHWSALVDVRLGGELVGQRVEFDSALEPRGLKASNIRLAK